jgi:hypothetical protein
MRGRVPFNFALFIVRNPKGAGRSSLHLLLAVLIELAILSEHFGAHSVDLLISLDFVVFVATVWASPYHHKSFAHCCWAGNGLRVRRSRWQPERSVCIRAKSDKIATVVFRATQLFLLVLLMIDVEFLFSEEGWL